MLSHSLKTCGCVLFFLNIYCHLKSEVTIKKVCVCRTSAWKRLTCRLPLPRLLLSLQAVPTTTVRQWICSPTTTPPLPLSPTGLYPHTHTPFPRLSLTQHVSVYSVLQMNKDRMDISSHLSDLTYYNVWDCCLWLCLLPIVCQTSPATCLTSSQLSSLPCRALHPYPHLTVPGEVNTFSLSLSLCAFFVNFYLSIL